jgi:riboflavin kinase/FMN adenylyltransferase
MKVIHGIENLTEKFPYPVVTMGNFDGVHLGHREIFNQLNETARHHNGTSIIITFHPHPVHLLHPDRALPMITDLSGRLEQFSLSGIDVVIVIDFTEEFSRLSPEYFIEEILVKKIGVKVFYMGSDFGFGQGRRGNREMLERSGLEYGFDVRLIEAVLIGNRVVSSTLIRNLIQDGSVAEIPEYLGRHYTVRAPVIRGMGRGTELGIPTANLEVHDRFLPKSGVYIADAEFNHRNWPGIAYIGTRPTFGDNDPALEIHLFEEPGVLYGKEITVRFIRRLRGDRRFDSPESLIAQIRKDMSIAQDHFKCKKC